MRVGGCASKACIRVKTEFSNANWLVARQAAFKVLLKDSSTHVA